jgi:hypothetical protein
LFFQIKDDRICVHLWSVFDLVFFLPQPIFDAGAAAGSLCGA